jgi:hypothetical protein
MGRSPNNPSGLVTQYGPRFAAGLRWPFPLKPTKGGLKGSPLDKRTGEPINARTLAATYNV